MTDNERGQPAQNAGLTEQAEKSGRASGQALVEYALIATLVMIGIIAVLTVTGPTVGNIFSNTVYNLLGQTFDTLPMPSDREIQTRAKNLETLTPPSYNYKTNTPLIPTCSAGPYVNQSAPLEPLTPGALGTYTWPCPGT